MMVGNGKDINITEDKWVHGNTIRFKREEMMNDPNRPVMVADLTQNGKWNEPALMRWFNVVDMNSYHTYPANTMQEQTLLERIQTGGVYNKIGLCPSMPPKI